MPGKLRFKAVRLAAAFLLLLAATVANGTVGCALGLCQSECEMHAAVKVQDSGCCEDKLPEEKPPCECNISSWHSDMAGALPMAPLGDTIWVAVLPAERVPIPEPIQQSSDSREALIAGSPPTGPPGIHTSRAPPSCSGPL